MKPSPIKKEDSAEFNDYSPKTNYSKYTAAAIKESRTLKEVAEKPNKVST